MHPFRRFVKACMAIATLYWEIWAQESLRRYFRLSISWIFTAHQPLQLSPRRRTMWFKSGLFGGQASGLRYRKQAWSRWSRQCGLWLQGNQQELPLIGYDTTAVKVVPLLVSPLGGSWEMSRAKLASLMRYGDDKHIFPFDEIWTRKKPTTIGLQALTTTFEMEIECE